MLAPATSPLEHADTCIIKMLLLRFVIRYAPPSLLVFFFVLFLSGFSSSLLFFRLSFHSFVVEKIGEKNWRKLRKINWKSEGKWKKRRGWARKLGVHSALFRSTFSSTNSQVASGDSKHVTHCVKIQCRGNCCTRLALCTLVSAIFVDRITRPSAYSAFVLTQGGI